MAVEVYVSLQISWWVEETRKYLMHSQCLPYRFESLLFISFPLGRLHLPTEIVKIKPRVILRNGSDTTCEAGIVYHPGRQVICRRYHPDMSGITWIGEDLENTCQILAGTASNADPIEPNRIAGFVKAGQPFSNTLSQGQIAIIRPIQQGWGPNGRRGQDSGGCLGQGGGGQQGRVWPASEEIDWLFGGNYTHVEIVDSCHLPLASMCTEETKFNAMARSQSMTFFLALSLKISAWRDRGHVSLVTLAAAI